MRDRNERKIVNRIAYQLVTIFEDYYIDDSLSDEGLERIINLLRGTPTKLRTYVFDRFLQWLDMRKIQYDRNQFKIG